MALAPGTRLGPYEVTAQIGEGGMGQVYRARDTTLNRAVALKVLPDAFANDADRLTRFTREAQTLASLNHPNIAAIYGVEESDGVRALVMELVEGEDLSQRIGRGAMPLDEALPIAKQIAEALEAAHEQGIIHRDLKPANIKVRADGAVKVLDFGLAKAMDSGLGAGDPRLAHTSQAPTITTPAMMTGLGMILGTAAYMSPEQARGRPVDRRTDIWAFGCVLFEMLTGQRAFGGAEVVDTIAAVISREPDWSTLPRSMPLSIVHLLRRCLDKDPKRRLRDVGEARLALEGSLEPGGMSERTPEAVVQPRVRRTIPILIAAAAGMAIATGVAALRSVPPSLDEPTVRLTVQPNQVFGNPGVSELALSPDGRHLAFVDRGRTGKTLWIHALETGEVRELPGTDGAWYPFWSPDGRFVGYYDTRGDIGSVSTLRRVSASGGPVQTVTEVTTAAGATWNEAGVIVFGGQAGGLLHVPAAGGTPVPLTTVDDLATETSHRFPQFLPGGTHLLYFVSAERPEQRGVYMRPIDADDATRVLATEVPGVFVSPGYILTVQDETLLAYPFDVETMAVTGGAVAIADGVGRGSFTLYPGVSASRNGVLAYGSALGIGSTQLIWSDRTGRRLSVVGAPESVIQVRLSPDEARVLLLKRDPRTNLNDIWVTEVTTQVSAPLAGNGGDPIWSPDGRRVAFYATRGAVRGIYEKPVGGGGEKLLLAGSGNTEDWTRDGSSIVIRQGGVPFLLPLSESSTPSQLMPQAAFGRNQFHVSPSGKWIAYTSNESGTTEVWVASFPSFADSRQVSSGGGDVPRWRGDERELYHLGPDGAMMSVGITVGSGIQAGLPTRLFQTRIIGSGGFDRYDVTSDGQRFLLLEPPESASAPPITVVTNWTSLLRR